MVILKAENQQTKMSKSAEQLIHAKEASIVKLSEDVDF